MVSSRLEKKLEFDQIREILKNHCRGKLGEERVESLGLMIDQELIADRLDELKEMMVLVDKMEAPTQPDYDDPAQIFKKLRIKDSYLIEEELSLLKSLMNIYEEWKNCFKQHEEELLALEPLMLDVDFPSYLQYRLDETIDEHGLIRSKASDALSRIRKKTTRLKEKIRSMISRALSDAKKKGFANDEAEWSLRNGRFVIPLQVAFKRAVGGFVMDYSGSGQTAFVEPKETFALNNELMDLQQEEKEEIIRILKELTDECRNNESGLLGICELVGNLDFIRAKAFLGQDLEGLVGLASKERGIDLKGARHPLLWINHQKEGKPVIPVNLQLDKESRILVISGPNAGGKSVALKTVGLLQYMHQCGLPISAEKGSWMGSFENFFVDIGDDQSIENDLSTFSSHMVTMTQALREAGLGSLLLFDEFGTGTDPLIGGAIGQALLVEFNKKKCFGVINTHYPNLKKLADTEDGIQNAAMLFDRGKMKPTFELSRGQAGSSFALEIAKRSGIPEKVLKKARSIAGEDFMAFDQLLLETQEKSMELEELKRKLKKENEKVNQLREELEEKYSGIKAEKKEILNRSKIEAQEILKTANKRIEETIRKIKEAEADPKVTKTLRQELDSFKEKAKPSIPETPKQEKKGMPLEIGKWVKLKDSDNTGKLTEIDGKEAIVEIGNLRLRVKSNQLEVTDGPTPKSLTGSRGKRRIRPEDAFDPQLDLRGLRVGEASEKLIRFLDEAEVNQKERLRVIHGKGEGHLKRAVSDLLNQSGLVRKFYFESEQFGGDGVTIVEL